MEERVISFISAIHAATLSSTMAEPYQVLYGDATAEAALAAFKVALRSLLVDIWTSESEFALVLGSLVRINYS
jgi:hypothetical protein